MIRAVVGPRHRLRDFEALAEPAGDGVVAENVRLSLKDREERPGVDVAGNVVAEGVEHGGEDVHVLANGGGARSGGGAPGKTNEKRATDVALVQGAELAAGLALQIVVAEAMPWSVIQITMVSLAMPRVSSFSRRRPTQRSE